MMSPAEFPAALLKRIVDVAQLVQQFTQGVIIAGFVL